MEITSAEILASAWDIRIRNSKSQYFEYEILAVRI